MTNEKKLFELIILFLVGGIVYMGIEMLWRGRTDITSFIMGGIAMIVAGSLNEFYEWYMPIWLQMLSSGFFITAMEFIIGSIFNQDYHIWDYRNMFLNLEGQICLLYSFFWTILSIIAIILDDYLRYWFFGEEKPHYNL